MQLYGLIGYPLSHSFSKRYFTGKFAREGIADCAYELFPLEGIHLLPGLIANHPELRGLNVTIPYKEAVLPYLDEVREAARSVGAVNTIAIRSGRLIGYNTDAYGFEVSLRAFLAEAGIPCRGALVLGSGGAAKAVGYVLDKMGMAWRLVSRRGGAGRLRYEEIDDRILQQHTLLINTTPLGMAPNTDSAPSLPYDRLTAQHLLYDLVYNPEKTIFLTEGMRRGCHTKNGLDMLHLQAERAWAIWQSTD